MPGITRPKAFNDEYLNSIKEEILVRSSNSLNVFMTLVLGLSFQAKSFAQKHMAGQPDSNAKSIPCTGALCVKTDGKIYLYYCAEKDVRIRVCTEKKVVREREDCVGPERSLPKTKFLEAVYAQISVANATQLKPLSTEDIKNSRKKTEANTGELEACVTELSRKVKVLEEFINWLEPIDAKEDREELERLKGELATKTENLKQCRIQNKDFDEATKKIKSHVEELMANICEEQLHLVKLSFHKDTLLYTVLDRFDPGKFPCGKTGTTDERIAECRKLNQEAEKKTSKDGTFQLVSQTENGAETWKDAKTGLVWHDVLHERLNWGDAHNACEKLGLRLPTAEEFEAAERNGFRDALPNMEDRRFWSSSLDTQLRNLRVFNVRYGKVFGDFDRYSDFSVRCVGR